MERVLFCDTQVRRLQYEAYYLRTLRELPSDGAWRLGERLSALLDR